MRNIQLKARENFRSTYTLSGQIKQNGTGMCQFLYSNRPGNPQTRGEQTRLEKSGIRVAVGDCSAAEHRQWRPADQTAQKLYISRQYTSHIDVVFLLRGFTRGHMLHGKCHATCVTM